ncbi:23S rRNA (adenine(2503)-C(2))-methyltransferase RlmN, partial [Listeria monocytogenes]|nr:23S rRNA (adenine(2503)-C(2))-methyltransferase RlmN [Listeria monocytogenes]
MKRGKKVNPSIYGLTKSDLSLWITEQNEKKFRANQVWEWLYEKRVTSFEEMTNLPKPLIEKLTAAFVINPLKQMVVQEASDGTVKYLFQLPDNH